MYLKNHPSGFSKANPKLCNCGAVIDYRCTRCALCRKKDELNYDEAKTCNKRKRILIHERGHQCESCLLTVWKDDKIPLDLDHIDGDGDNNSRNNLRLLCPNCHAQTPTYKGRNKGRGTVRQLTRMAKYYKRKEAVLT